MREAGNIRQIAALNPDYMGFIFYPLSVRYFGSDYDLIANIPGNIEKVGVFVNEQPKRIVEIAQKCGLNAIQLHGSEPPEDCRHLKDNGLKVIKAFGVHGLFNFTVPEDYSSVCDFFLFDTKTEKYGGSGEKFDKDLIDLYNMKNPFFLSGGIDPGDIEYIRQIDHPGFYAVDLNSRFETQPGIKDFQSVRNFINEIRGLSSQQTKKI